MSEKKQLMINVVSNFIYMVINYAITFFLTSYVHFGSIIIMHDYSSKDLKTKELNRGMSIEV